MNDLLDTVTETYPVNLDNLIETRELPTARIPEASIRNQAALTALLSDDPSKVIDNYRSIVYESQTGQEYTKNTIMKNAQSRQAVHDREGLMSVLADPNIDIETKKKAIQNINNDFNKDTATIVATESAKAPSGEESVEAENVRVNSAVLWNSIRESKEFKQKILNREYAKLNPDTGKLLLGAAETMLMPFGINKVGYGVLNDIMKELGIEESRARSAATPGSAITKIREKLASIPPQDVAKIYDKVSQIISNNDKIIFTRDNDFAKMQLLTSLFGEEYGTFDKVLDNTVGLLDVIGVGTLARSGIKKISSLFTRTPENTERNVKLNAVQSEVSPVSPIKILEDTNPEKARKAYEAVVNSQTEEVALALSGASKSDLIADMKLPQPASVDGSLQAKLSVPDRNIVVNEEIVKELEDTGAIYLSEMEKAQADSKVFRALRDATGVTLHDNLVSIGHVGGKQEIRATYGTSEGGFLKADDAITQVKLSLREFGVVDSDLQLLKKVDDEYVPVSLREVEGVDGDYLVQLKLNRNINASDITQWDEESVRLNWFDRLPSLRSNKAGTLANTLLDHASMLSERYTGAAVTAFDKSVRVDKLFLQMHTKFSDAYIKLPETRKQKVYDYIKEANALELDLNDNQLLARGFVKEEIDILNTWKKNWDTHFYFENNDLVKTLSNQGYKVLETVTGDKLYAKEVGKHAKVTDAYDPSTGNVVKLSSQEVDNLYNSGGTYAVLRRPIDINGTAVEHIISRNTPNEYLRGLRDFDQVLNYKKGYYQVAYKAPKFVDQIIRSPSGNEIYRKAVAAAGSTEEATHISKRLASSQGIPAEDFHIRDDIKKLYVDTDAYWDLHSASGRIAQRHRGQRLETPNASVTSFDTQYILDPVESAIRASRSIAGRVSTRDMFETMKQRAMSQYKEFFPKGQWVENSNSLVDAGNKNSKKIADARTTVEYINYLQHGYVNGFDQTFKEWMNAVANMLTKYEPLEKMFLHLGDLNPTRVGKSGVYQSYIALNPARQLLIQSHQLVRLLGYNPFYMLKNFALDTEKYWRYAVLSDISKASKADREMVEFVQKSGMLDAVDKHNLIRGSLTDMAESQNIAMRAAGKAIAIPRKIGFDTGEQANLLAHLLAVRDSYIKAGKNISDPAVRDEAYSVARAMAYDMNFAGDMPYNQNSFGLFLQFFQVPHKAFLTYTNRRIPTRAKVGFFIADAILFGLPGAAAIEHLVGREMLPSDPVDRERVLFGLTSTVYNGVLSNLAGEDVKVDFSSLSPYGYEGFAHLAHAVVSGGMLEFIQNSPAFSLYLKDGSKFQEALGRMFRYFGFIDTQEGLEKETLTSVMQGVAEISSGWSNAYKAYMILESGKIIDKKTGKPIMEDANTMYAFAQLFGFKSQKEVFEWAALKEINQNKKDIEADWQKVYDSYIRILTRDGQTSITDPDAQEKLLGMIKKMYAGDYKAQEWFNNRLSKDMVDRQDVIIRRAIESSLYKEGDPLTALKNLKMLKVEEYDKALKLHEDLNNALKKGEDE